MDDKLRAFQEFERQGWQEVARTYADVSGTATSKVADVLLDAAEVERGQRVLDVATGPGFVAGAAARRGARAVGLDISEAMLEEASKRHPEIELRQGAAESLPFGDEEFDAVVSAFGMPHFADHAAFFAESHRVLRPGGRLAFATWRPPDRNPFFGLVVAAVARGGSLSPADLPEGPEFSAFGDPATCERALEQAGFGGFRTRDFSIDFPVEAGAAGLVRFIEEGSVRTRALFRAQSDEARLRIQEAMEELLAPFRSSDAAAVPASVLVVSARR